MPVIKSDQARIFEVPGVTFTALAAPSTGSSELSAWRISIAPRTTGEAHACTREEVFIATGGAAAVMLDGAQYVLETGDALSVPAGVQFAISNPHETPFTAVVALPVGGQAVTEHGTFTPPWAE